MWLLNFKRTVISHNRVGVPFSNEVEIVVVIIIKKASVHYEIKKILFEIEDGNSKVHLAELIVDFLEGVCSRITENGDQIFIAMSFLRVEGSDREKRVT